MVDQKMVEKKMVEKKMVEKKMVELRGFEPLTSAVRLQRSPS